jgi:hypothetical protein
MVKLRFACVVLAACSEPAAAPGTPPGTPPVRPVPPASAATALARTFAPEIVGTLAPSPPRAGDYAMALAMSFETFPSMEMRISERRTGALRLTLAGDGTARACLGSKSTHTVQGQYHYEPPGRRQHSERVDARLLALAGQWQVADGVATIRFDHLTWGTCDLAKATKLDKPVAELRCIGAGPPARVPAGSLACEATESSQLLDLGMPMTVATRQVPASPMHLVPAGRNVMLGAPGLAVDVAQDSHAMTPTITFRAGPVTLVEADYRPPK